MICNCGHDKFYFVGVQAFPFEPYFLNLFNCYNCRTTISIQAPRDEIPKPKAVAASSVVGSKQTFNYVKADEVSFLFQK